MNEKTTAIAPAMELQDQVAGGFCREGVGSSAADTGLFFLYGSPIKTNEYYPWKSISGGPDPFRDNELSLRGSANLSSS
jgi:hypothetical protein